MTVRQSDRYRCLVQVSQVTEGLLAIERRLSAAGLAHKRRKAVSAAGDTSIRLLVARRHFNSAFRELVELTAVHQAKGSPAIPQALSSPASGG